MNARCGEYGGVRPGEGHLEEGYRDRAFTGWGGVVLPVEDILINWTGEKCSHIEMFTL